MIDKDLTHKVDKLNIALVLLISALRSNTTVENKQVMASIPEFLLDQIEAILRD